MHCKLPLLFSLSKGTTVVIPKGEALYLSTCLQADLLLVVPLSGVQQDVPRAPLGSQHLCLVPECSLRTAEGLEKAAALSWAQELRVLGKKTLDVKCGVL